jgi:DNA-binding MarR family transcriptional regulator
MTGPAQPDGAGGQGIAGRLALDGDLAPSVRELALLQQWHSLHSGVQRLTSGLLADVEAENGLTPSSFQALMFLVAAPGQAAPMNQLAQALGFSTAGTTKVVDRLAGAGLVERRPSGSDRRVTYTALTAEGAERVLAASRTLARVLRTRVVEPLGEELFGTLARAIGSLAPDTGAC